MRQVSTIELEKSCRKGVRKSGIEPFTRHPDIVIERRRSIEDSNYRRINSPVLYHSLKYSFIQCSRVNLLISNREGGGVMPSSVDSPRDHVRINFRFPHKILRHQMAGRRV